MAGVDTANQRILIGNLGDLDRNNYIILSGVQNISFSHNIPEDTISVLGNDFVGTELTSRDAVSFSIDKLFLSDDALLNKTGIPFDIYFGYKEDAAGKSLRGSRAYINDFSLNISDERLPTISYNGTIYGNIDNYNYRLFQGATIHESGYLDIPKTGIVVTKGDDVNGYVQSLSFSEAYDFQQIPSITQAVDFQNQNARRDVYSLGPVLQSMEINYIPNSFKQPIIYNPASIASNRNEEIKVSVNSASGLVKDFSLLNSRIISDNLNAGVGDTLLGNITYEGNRNDNPPDLNIEVSYFNFLEATDNVLRGAITGVAASSSQVELLSESSFSKKIPSLYDETVSAVQTQRVSQIATFVGRRDGKLRYKLDFSSDDYKFYLGGTALNDEDAWVPVGGTNVLAQGVNIFPDRNWAGFTKAFVTQNDKGVAGGLKLVIEVDQTYTAIDSPINVILHLEP